MFNTYILSGEKKTSFKIQTCFDLVDLVTPEMLHHEEQSPETAKGTLTFEMKPETPDDYPRLDLHKIIGERHIIWQYMKNIYVILSIYLSIYIY